MLSRLLSFTLPALAKLPAYTGAKTVVPLAIKTARNPQTNSDDILSSIANLGLGKALGRCVENAQAGGKLCNNYVYTAADA